MITEREKMFGVLPDGAYLYCIHCERAYPKGKYRIMSDIDLGLLQMCPYEDCDGDAVMDAWEWERILSDHSEYPDIPEENKVYPLHNYNLKAP